MKGINQDWSLLLTRIVLAAVFLFHGIPKATDFAMAMEKFAGMGFPGFLGPVVGIVEVIAAVVILLGIADKWFKWSNCALAVIILVAILFVQAPGAMAKEMLLTAGLERDLLIVAATLVLGTTGPGKLAWMLKKS